MAGGAYPVTPGRSLVEILWEDLLSCIDRLMDKDELDLPEDDPDNNRLKGRAEGVAWCIAVILHSPKTPDINEVKAEAMERWEASRTE